MQFHMKMNLGLKTFRPMIINQPMNHNFNHRIGQVVPKGKARGS